MAEDFAIPQAKGMFEEPAPMGQLVVTAVSEDGMQAVNVLTVEVDETGAFVSELTPDEADAYGQELLNGGEDTRGLEIGRFDGENAEADAFEQADDLNEDAPMPDASDEDKALAAVAAKGENAEDMLEDMEEEIPGKMPGKKRKGMKPSPDEAPMLEQFAEYPGEY